jgi:hypothetical protein
MTVADENRRACARSVEMALNLRSKLNADEKASWLGNLCGFNDPLRCSISSTFHFPSGGIAFDFSVRPQHA